MKDIDYAFAVALIRVNEIKLLTRQDIGALLAAKDYKSCLQLLADKGWGVGSDLDEAQMLAAEQKKLWALIEEAAPQSGLFEALYYKNDFHNVKAAIECLVSDLPIEKYMISPSVFSHEVVSTAIKNKQYELLGDELGEVACEAYRIMLETGDSQLMEAIVDKASIELTVKKARECKMPLLENLLGFEALCATLKTAMRCAATKKELAFNLKAIADIAELDREGLSKAALSGVQGVLDYVGDHGFDEATEQLKISLSAFEKWAENKRMSMVQHGKLEAFGEAPLIGYILAREAEIKNVRIILSGHRSGISQEKISERLRELYV